MGQFVIRTYQQILQRMINRVCARTILNDLTETSTLFQVLSAAAREDDEQYFQMLQLAKIQDLDSVTGPELDELAQIYNPQLLIRQGATVATGSVVFSRQGTTGTATINVGQEVKVPGTDLKYYTTESASITPGNNDSSPTDIRAGKGGADYNVDPDSITAFGTKPSGVDTVTNLSAITNGTDIESDDEFRTRIKFYLKSISRGTCTALIYAALLAEDSTTGKKVRYVNVVEDVSNLGNVTVYIDDGSGTAESVGAVANDTLVASAVGGEINFYTVQRPIKTESGFTVTRTGPAPAGEPTGVLTEGTDFTLNPASGHLKLTQGSFPNGLPATSALTISYTPFTGLIALAQKIIDGDAADRSNYPGYRAAGVLVRVLSPSIVWQSLIMNITVKPGFSQTDVADDVAASISTYVNSLGIGEDVIVNEIRERSMAVQGMYDLQLISPTANQIILDSQLARLASGSITVS
jgi:uncharacterized phage protein gp47/JayE